MTLYLENILFYFFESFLIISSIMVITSTNAMYSIFFLILVFTNATCLLLLLGAEFLALVIILIYIGAVAVLFLFVIMMVDIKHIDKKEKNFFSKLPINILIGFVLLTCLYFVIFNDLTFDLKPTDTQIKFYNWLKHVHSFSNIETVGQYLYTTGFLYFLLSGIILLVAMFSSIILIININKSVKRQQINEQIIRKVNNSIFLIDKEKK